MKTTLLPKLITAAILTLGSLVQAKPNLNCQVYGTSPGGSKVPIQVSILYGQGPQGSDLTLLTTSQGQKQYASPYRSLQTRAGSSASSQLMDAHGKNLAYVTIYYYYTGSISGSLSFSPEYGGKSFSLSCQEVKSLQIPPDPRPCPRC